MISKKQFPLVMGLLMMFALAVSMSIVVIYINTKTFLLVPILISILQAFVINFIASLIIPANMLGDKFAKKCNAKENSFYFIALSNLIVCLIYVTIVSFGMTVINVGFNGNLLPAWLSTYPILLIIGYVISLLFTPIAVGIATKIASKE